MKNGKYIVGLCRSPRKKSHCGKIQPKPRKPLVLGGPTALSECRLEYNWAILGWKHHGILVASQHAVGGPVAVAVNLLVEGRVIMMEIFHTSLITILVIA